MNFRKVIATFWAKAAARGWDLKSKSTALYILTSPNRITEGLFFLPKKYMQLELGLSAKNLDKALKNLIEDDFIRYDDQNSVVLIKSALKYNSTKNINYHKSALKKIRSLPNTHLLFDFLELAAKYSPSLKEFMLAELSRDKIKTIFLEKCRAEELTFEQIYDRFKKNILADAETDVEVDNLKQQIDENNDQAENQVKAAEDEELSSEEIEIIHPSEEKSEKAAKRDADNFFNQPEMNTDIMKIVEINQLDAQDEEAEASKEHSQAKFKKGKSFELTKYLIKRIKDNNRRARVPDIKSSSSLLKSWVKAVERLHRLGPVGSRESDDQGYSWQEIRNLIDFSQDNQFWMSNILSAKKLRKQVIKLENQMKSSNKSKSEKKMDMLEKVYLKAVEDDKKNEEE